MEVLAKCLTASKFEVSTRGHNLISDQPVDNGGQDEGMTPPELLLAALASCAGYYAAQYLKTRNLSTNGLSVQVVAEKALQPARLSRFRIEVRATPLDEKNSAGLLRSVHACLVHNTLLNLPEIEVLLTPIAS